MNLYEVIFITRPDVSVEQVNKVTERFSSLISDKLNGSIKKTEQWGLRTLAYIINKHRKGYYTLLGAEMPASSIDELERQLNLSEDIIRFMTVRVDEITDAPSPLMGQGSDDEKFAA